MSCVSKKDVGKLPSYYDMVHAIYAKDGECGKSIFNGIKPTHSGKNFERETGRNHIGIRMNKYSDRAVKGVTYGSAWNNKTIHNSSECTGDFYEKTPTSFAESICIGTAQRNMINNRNQIKHKVKWEK